METKTGYVECRLTKTDPEIIEMVSKRIGKPTDRVYKMMRYNMFTVRQFAVLTGLTVATILNKTSQSVINGVIDTELDYCYPFGVEEEDGPKFILRNSKTDKYFKL